MPKKQPNKNNSDLPQDDLISSLEEQILELTSQLSQAQEKERRALADYQNLIRRTQEERVRLIKMANVDIMEALIQPLDHLSLAATQLNDPGLNMVVGQFQQSLAQFGLEEMEAMGKKFDVETMEVVENSENDSDTVTSVVKKGYKLNGQVIQHAKVILG